jgi:hypothetical protein
MGGTMITFKAFLEGANTPPTTTTVNATEALHIIETHCKASQWRIKDNKPIMKGDRREGLTTFLRHTGYFTVDTSKTQRFSQNTSNYYTLILDHHPDRQHFPKRSQSFICSTIESTAYSYAHGDEKRILYILPYDTAKIGSVNREDLWNSQIGKLFGGLRIGIESMNDYFEELGIEENWESFLDFDKRLKAGEHLAVENFRSTFRNASPEDEKHFLERIFDAYSESETGHSTGLPSRDSDGRGEVWVGGECLVMGYNQWNDIRKAFLKSWNDGTPPEISTPSKHTTPKSQNDRRTKSSNDDADWLKVKV